MAKYDITRSCGHTETIAIDGPYKDRDAVAQREAEKQCGACYQATVAAKRAQAATDAAAEANTAGLPQLTGTDKQVAWALSVRREAVTQLTALRAKLVAKRDASPATSDVAVGIIDQAIAITSAGWWIDHRDELRLVHDWVSRRTRAALEGSTK